MFSKIEDASESLASPTEGHIFHFFEGSEATQDWLSIGALLEAADLVHILSLINGMKRPF